LVAAGVEVDVVDVLARLIHDDMTADDHLALPFRVHAVGPTQFLRNALVDRDMEIGFGVETSMYENKAFGFIEELQPFEEGLVLGRDATYCLVLLIRGVLADRRDAHLEVFAEHQLVVAEEEDPIGPSNSGGYKQIDDSDAFWSAVDVVTEKDDAIGERQDDLEERG
jgi:hypothetical protein